MHSRPGRIPAWALTYDTGDHPPYAYTADVVGLVYAGAGDGLDVLVVERAREPFAGRVAIPGGFVDWEGDDNARSAALRELREETGATEPAHIEALDTYDAYGRDPRQFAGRIIDGQFVRRGNRVVSRTDLALFRTREPVRPEAGEDAARAFWSPLSRYLPWEDLRSQEGRAARARVLDALLEHGAGMDASWREQLHHAFGAGAAEWNEERAGERFRLLLQAGLVEEGTRDRFGQPMAPAEPTFGEPLAFDHRTMIADALGRLRGKIKYVPGLLAALAPPRFTVSELQSLVEAISGRTLETANFRRLVAHSRGHALITPTGDLTSSGGRPAEIYTWKMDFAHVRLERSIRFPWQSH